MRREASEAGRCQGRDRRKRAGTRATEDAPGRSSVLEPAAEAEAVGSGRERARQEDAGRRWRPRDGSDRAARGRPRGAGSDAATRARRWRQTGRTRRCWGDGAPRTGPATRGGAAAAGPDRGGHRGGGCGAGRRRTGPARHGRRGTAVADPARAPGAATPARAARRRSREEGEERDGRPRQGGAESPRPTDDSEAGTAGHAAKQPGRREGPETGGGATEPWGPA